MRLAAKELEPTLDQLNAQARLVQILDGVLKGVYSLEKYGSNSKYRVIGLEEKTGEGDSIFYEVVTKGPIGTSWYLVEVTQIGSAIMRHETEIVDILLKQRLMTEVFDGLSRQEIKERVEDNSNWLEATHLRNMATELAGSDETEPVLNGQNGHEDDHLVHGEIVVYDASSAN